MKLSHKQLLNLPVYTKSQEFLGRVEGFEFNPEDHTINKYLVSQSSFVQNIIGSFAKNLNLEIATSQVVSINQEKMIVEDNVAKDLETIKQKQPAPSPSPASTSSLSQVAEPE